MIRQVFYVQGFPDLLEGTNITIQIPANGGQSFPVEVELPAQLLVDVNQASRLEQTTVTQPSASFGSRPTPNLSVVAEVSADNTISPLRRDPSLNTGERFLPSISSRGQSPGRLEPRNQTLPSREPTVRSGLPFTVPNPSSGSTAPTFRTSTAPSTRTTGLPSRPLTGVELAESFMTSTPASTLNPTSRPSTTKVSPTRMLMASSSPSRASSSSLTPSLSVANSPTSIASVLTSPSMSGLAFSAPGSIEEEAPAEEEPSVDQPTSASSKPGTKTAPMSAAQPAPTFSGKELYIREAKAMIRQAGLDIDPDLQQETIDESWNELTPDEQNTWNADAQTSSQGEETVPSCELPHAGSPSHPPSTSSPSADQPEKLKPSCNMALLLMKYATAEPK